MKYILTLLLIFSCIIQASTFELNKEDIEKIKDTYDNKKIFTRFKRYQAFLKEAESYDLMKKLNRVNSKINRIIPAYDKQSQNMDDYWLTPKEFMILGRGDCEDYAIAKYFSLKDLGIDTKKLYLAVVRVRKNKTLHMVILYFKTKTSIPFVLDNLSWKILPLDKRKDLAVKFIFNEHSSFLLENYKTRKKVKIDWGKEDKWQNIIDRVYKK
jgi:predicted transglutaminase-like cysteine proteinase